jgi:hypothetical protein
MAIKKVRIIVMNILAISISYTLFLRCRLKYYSSKEKHIIIKKQQGIVRLKMVSNIWGLLLTNCNDGAIVCEYTIDISMHKIRLNT